MEKKKAKGNEKVGNKIPKNNLLFGLGYEITKEQKKFADDIYNPKKLIVFCDAKAGTGKTTIAVAVAKLLFQEEKYRGLVYVFNPTEEDKMGFRPGSQEEKELLYLTPLKDALIEIGDMPEKAISGIIKEPGKSEKFVEGWVEAKSHIFLRGTNTRERVVIIDEAQNFTVDQLRKVLTRCHDTCKVIVIGHHAQIDLLSPNDSGFLKYLDHFKDETKCSICTLTKNFRGWIADHADKIDKE
jgi:phosphate starvation-inducible protein PhoH and related proteins